MYLIWQKNGTVLRSGSVDGSLIFPMMFPATLGEAQAFTLTSSAKFDGSYSTLQNLQLYLQGDPLELDTILNVWPNYGVAFNPPHEELNGGFEFSFDGGSSFHRFGNCMTCGQRHGFPDDPSTWVTVPASAITNSATDGVLGAFQVANFLARYRVPPQANQFQIFTIRLEAAFDTV